MARIVMMEIDEEGNPTIETAGYTGKGCEAIQKAFGEALGTTTKAVKKPEYFKTVTIKQKLVQ